MIDPLSSKKKLYVRGRHFLNKDYENYVVEELLKAPLLLPGDKLVFVRHKFADYPGKYTVTTSMVDLVDGDRATKITVKLNGRVVAREVVQ